MTCRERQDQILLYVAGQLDSAEEALLREHLNSGCPVCAGSLAEAEAILASLAATMPAVQPPPHVFEAIRKRITAPGNGPQQFSTFRQRSSWLQNLRLIGLSTGIAAMLTFALTWQLTERSRQFIRSNNLRLVDLSGTDKQSDAKGRVLWDREHNQWQVTVFNLSPPPPGRTFELWFITTDQKKIRASTFDINHEGVASLFVAVPANLSLAMAAVTDEPVGGSDQPTGTIRLAGAIAP